MEDCCIFFCTFPARLCTVFYISIPKSTKTTALQLDEDSLSQCCFCTKTYHVTTLNREAEWYSNFIMGKGVLRHDTLDALWKSITGNEILHHHRVSECNWGNRMHTCTNKIFFFKSHLFIRQNPLIKD